MRAAWAAQRTACAHAPSPHGAFSLGRGLNRPEPSYTVHRPSPVPVCGEAAQVPPSPKSKRLQMRSIMRSIALIILVGAGLNGWKAAPAAATPLHWLR